MASRFRIFHTSINLKLESIEKVVMACCVLHNYLRRKCSSSYILPHNLDEENFGNGEVTLGLRAAPVVFGDLQRGPNRNYGETAKNVRETFLTYLNGEGRVAWQNNIVNGNN